MTERQKQPKRQTKQQKDQFEESIQLDFLKDAYDITAFLTNFKTSSFFQDGEQRSAVICYFQDECGNRFKCWYQFDPYFFVGFQQNYEHQVRAYLQSKIQGVQKIEVIKKVDLQQKDHLLGKKKSYIKISFRTITQLINARNPLRSEIQKRKKKTKNIDENYYQTNLKKNNEIKDINQMILDIRQHDVPYHSRVCIDTGLRAGKWFKLQIKNQMITKLQNSPKQTMPQLKVLAYDIECSKAPLKFPDAQIDEIIMISFACEGLAFLVVNTGFCGSPVQTFEYRPAKRPQFGCQVTVFNETSEKDTILRLSKYIRQYSPTVITSFNGDAFDYPFIKTRCMKNYINFQKQFGVKEQDGQYYGNFLSHLDCMYWVDRDAYLPQGSRGLKAVAKAKLNYEPEQVEVEEMVHAAKYDTNKLAYYSISDSVATYFLYMKHIHGFIFALATIIPMTPDEVLRKGSGTLCQLLLMVEAFNREIVFPNKYVEKFEKFYKGHLLDNETYTGGRVECLRSGVYRSDFPTDFQLTPQAFDDLIENLEQTVKFAVKERTDDAFENIENYNEVKEKIKEGLQMLRDVQNPRKFETKPLIYHIDVAAMYPNIILTNRLQPVAIVNDVICSNCYYNKPQNNCKRQMQWQWKGQYFPLDEGEYQVLRQKQMKKRDSSTTDRQFEKQLKAEVKKYCQKIYSKVHVSASEVRTDTVCMRQNSFYVDTVRAFRDRRNEFKIKSKTQKSLMQKFKEKKDGAQAKEAEALMALYQSMQLAHKIILNSYYGYVMRKGSRWYSMQTAAMITYTGSNIIQDSKRFIEGRIGKPLQLDTDGIWMLLPAGFPESYKIKFKSGKFFHFEYPCQILNHLIYQKYANKQYQQLNGPNRYSTKTQMTIAFQIDGPYKAMMIPSAKQKQKTGELDIQQQSSQLLKKRYVVFDHNNSISEFKGFEIKRRGQLKITKIFQQELFPQYVKGNSLKECYDHCAQTARQYLSIIMKKGANLDTEQIIGYFQESKNLSRDIQDYGASKGLAITSARRLADFLGPQVIKGKKICCSFVISATPQDASVTQRAIPTLIFDADPEQQRRYLAKWTQLDSLQKGGQVDIRNILDWDYYMERLSTQIQKMICIPAVMQNIPNPVPQLQLPEWLQKKTYDMRHHKQNTILSFGFSKKEKDQTFIEKQKVANNSYHFSLTSPMKRQNQEGKDTRKMKLSKNPHSMMNKFPQWLIQQKKLWKNRKTEPVQNDTIKWSDLKSILQIIPQKTPGNFTVWFYAGGRIQQMLANLDRKYYLKDQGNKKAPRQQGPARQIVVSQQVFLKNQDVYDSILGRTFYETKIPLMTSLLINKGNLWKVTKRSATYQQNDIQQIFGEDYLPGMERQFLSNVYLSRAQISKNRTLWTLINPKTQEYYFVFVDRALGSANQELQKLARNLIKNSQAKIHIVHKNDEKEAATFINDTLNAYLKFLKHPFLTMLQSDQSIDFLRYNLGVTILNEEVPVLELSKFKIEGFQALGWKEKALKAVLKESSNASSQIMTLLNWSRYSNLPLCNLSSQKERLDFITNISLSRLLHSSDHLLWWNQYNQQLTTTYESNFYNGKVSNPGLYPSYCFQIQMQNFAVNAIANSQELMNLDREAAAMMMHKKKKEGAQVFQSLDEAAQAKVGFQYLKKMVRAWVKDIKSGSEEADSLLTNLHKWITSQNNSLYQPLLLRMVNQLMKKVFYRLMGKLTNLGLTIIFGNFSKIIVSTDKYTFQEADTRINYILSKCVQQQQKIFQYIRFETQQEVYSLLLFKDQFNYAGVADNEHLYRFQIANLMCNHVGNYLRWVIVQFLKDVTAVGENIMVEFAEDPLQLHRNYQIHLKERVCQFIRQQFKQKMIKAAEQLLRLWEKTKLEYKQQQAQQDTLSQENSVQEEQQQNDSFIDDEFSGQMEKLNIQVGNKRVNKINASKKQRGQIADIQKWLKDSQIDIFIENTFLLLNSTEAYKDAFEEVRKKVLESVHLKQTLEYRRLNPKYPKFQLPCSNCLFVNQNPGPCEHCRQQGTAQVQLQNTVWKMMQEQGRDLYCNLCKAIKQEYLRKCRCGGRWQITQHPLEWLPYTKRDTKQWEYVNKIFDFMGLKEEQPTYPKSFVRPEMFQQ